MPHVRCKKCDKRRTLKRKPEEYIRPPRCKGYGCKSREYRLDNYRRLVELRRRACTCMAYHFPHRKGSGACIFRERE